MASDPSLTSARVLGGRYLLYGEIGAGGMATVHLGLLVGPSGFSRAVAIKRLHPHLAKDPELVAMFVDEARLAARIRHPNVVATLDAVAAGEERFLVMDYVHGESLSALIEAARERGERIPPAIAATILAGVLHGLQAAHDACDERGQPLQMVHRDVSPQNVLVGVDGTARVLDFGIAKASGRIASTRHGQVKGKLGYIAPEQFETGASVASDIYGAGACLWEALTGQRLFHGDNESAVLAKVLANLVVRPSKRAPGLPPALDEITLRALARDPARRFQSAREMATSLETEVGLATASQVGDCVRALAADVLRSRASAVARMEEELSRSAARSGDAPSGVGLPSGSPEGAVVPVEARSAADAVVVTGTAPRRVPAAAWVTMGAAAATVLVLLGALLAPLRSPPGRAASPEVSTALPPLGSDPPPSASATTASAPPSPAIPTESASAPEPDRGPPAHLAVAPRRAPQTAGKPSRPRGPAPAERASPTGCAEPYTVDADGLKHYKKECLK